MSAFDGMITDVNALAAVVDHRITGTENGAKRYYVNISAEPQSDIVEMARLISLFNGETPQSIVSKLSSGSKYELSFTSITTAQKVVKYISLACGTAEISISE